MKIVLNGQQKAFIESLRHQTGYRSENWAMSNDVLYRMCRDHPRHDDMSIIADKLMMIGRVYAASLERHSGKDPKESSDRYYRRIAGELVEDLRGISLDERIDEINDFGKEPTDEQMKEIVALHKAFGDVLAKYQKENRFPRSFASKYLHFHCENAFFLYDDIASKRLSQAVKINFGNQTDKQLLKGFIGGEKYDDVYAKYFLRAQKLREQIKSDKNGLWLTPRQLDDLLLYHSASDT